MVHSVPAAQPGQLVLIATPIGNLEDISSRALEALRNCDLILCEDTRTSATLLKSCGVSKPCRAFHDHNETRASERIVSELEKGKNIALISDAGTPVISDPGYRLVSAVIKAGLPLDSIPGPNAAVLALTLSGLPPAPFTFLGFPPRSRSERKKLFEHLKSGEKIGLGATLVWYEAPHRIESTLELLQETFGEDRQAVIGRELTKRHQEILRGTLGELSQHFLDSAPRGEMTLLLAPPPASSAGKADNAEPGQLLAQFLATHSLKDAVREVAELTGLPKRLVYRLALDLDRGGSTPLSEA